MDGLERPPMRPLRRAERAAVGEWRRLGRMWGHGALSRLVGGKEILEHVLGRALLPPGVPEEDRPFAVPLPYALRGFAKHLCIELPTALLERRLADWVQCGRRAVHVGDYFLGLGSWEEIAVPFSRTGVMREAAELVRLDFHFRATRSYRYYKQCIGVGRPIRRNRIVLSSETLLDAYFERYLNLFRSIRQHGVLPLQSARRVAGDLCAGSGVRRYRTEAGERDIGVAIGPEGRIYGLPGGKHRTAIATVLGIPRVPVEVRMVHAEWVRAMQRRHACGAFEAVRRGIDELEAAHAF